MEMEMEERKVRKPKHPTIELQDDEEVKLKAKKRPRVDCSSNGLLERGEALQSRLDPKFPSFVKLMRRSHVSGCFWLGLPCFFCREHLPVEDETIYLINDKLETFEVMYLACKDGLSGGWRRFSIAQGLIDGDVLVFHLIMPTTFKVFILRSSSSSSAAAEGSKPKKKRRKPSTTAHQRLATKASSCKPASSAKPEHSGKSDNDNHGELSESEDHDQRIKQDVGLDIDQNCASQMISEERMRRKIKNGYRGCLEDRVCASENVVQAATKNAEELQAVLDPEFPSFVKSMSQSHVTGGFWLGLPRKFCKEHLPDEDYEITLIDENLDPFRTNYLVRSTALSGGWKGFSVFHKLVHGDALVFHLINPTTFKVYIIRARSSSNIHRNIDITYEENGVKPNNKRSGKNIKIQQPKQEAHQQMETEDAEECASDSGNVQPIATVSNRDIRNQCVADDIHEECATDNVNAKQEQEKKDSVPSGNCVQCFRLKQEARRKAMEAEIVIKENDELRFLRSCKVCMDRDVSMLLLPCKHLCLCKDCDPKLHICPICNTVKICSTEVFI